MLEYSPQPAVSYAEPNCDIGPSNSVELRGGETGDSPYLARRYTGPDGQPLEIQNVWANTLEEEMAKIRKVIQTHPYVAMDTEFPGIVARPVGDFHGSDYQYQTLRCNVDLLKMIQLGLSFANEKGELHPGCCCWQFNFKFCLDDDMYAQDSIDLLRQSGIHFARHESMGIDVVAFGELLVPSGLVLVDDVTWVSFHSGYDFGYLLKLLISRPLPDTEKEFFSLLPLYFPNLYDIKYLTANSDTFHGGLNKLGNDLKIKRIGQKHQAGSDSLLTAQVFFKMIEMQLGGFENLGKHNLELFGYGQNSTVYRPGSKFNVFGGKGEGHNASCQSAGSGSNNGGLLEGEGTQQQNGTVDDDTQDALGTRIVASVDSSNAYVSPKKMNDQY